MSKQRIGSWALISFCTFIACSHQSVRDTVPPPPLNLRPPILQINTNEDRTGRDQLFMQLSLIHQEKNVQWYANYRRAQLWANENPNLACELFGGLAQDTLFPLRDLAQLRAFETCEDDKFKKLELAEPKIGEVDPSLKDIAWSVNLKKAKERRQPELELQLLLEKSRSNIPLQLRLSLIERSIDLAGQLKNSNAETEAKRRLYRLAPRFNPAPKASEELSVAQDFRQVRDFERATEIYKRILANPSRSIQEHIQAYRGLRQAYKLSRERMLYLQTSKQLFAYASRVLQKSRGRKDVLKQYADVALDVTKSLWTNGYAREAQKILTTLEQKVAGQLNLSEVALVWGRMAEERKDPRLALLHFERALKQAQSSAAQIRLMWLIAWNQRRLGRLSEAIQTFEAIRNKADEPFIKNRSTFWLVKCLFSSGENKRAEVELRQLIQDDPMGYYGLLAYRELNIPIPLSALKPGATPQELAPQESVLKQVYDVNRVNWLLSVEEKPSAVRLLQSAADRMRSQQILAVESWQEILSQFVRSEAFSDLNEQLARLTPQMRMELLTRNPEYLFPRPFAEIVKNSSQQFNVSEELIYSIMRQESSFNPNARSLADAFGLMQILPELAAKTKLEARVPYREVDDLFDPKVNIPLGAAYLKSLWTRYQGQFVLVVSNYNAAEQAIQNWLQTRWRGDTLEFIEDIPYEETRGYIRLVMRNLIFYMLLRAPSSGLPFPEWLLELKPLST